MKVNRTSINEFLREVVLLPAAQYLLVPEFSCNHRNAVQTLVHCHLMFGDAVGSSSPSKLSGEAQVRQFSNVVQPVYLVVVIFKSKVSAELAMTDGESS
jgi:hypothetical protein